MYLNKGAVLGNYCFPKLALPLVKKGTLFLGGGGVVIEKNTVTPRALNWLGRFISRGDAYFVIYGTSISGQRRQKSIHPFLPVMQE